LEEKKMKKLLVLALVLAFVGAVQAVNQVANPGFENGPGGTLNNVAPGPFDSWQTWTWSNAAPTDSWARINADAHTGVASAEFGNNDALGWGGWAGGSGAFQGILIGQGTTATIEAYAKGITTNGASGIDLVFFNIVPDESRQNPANIGRADLLFANFGAPDLNGWRYGLLSAVCPPGTLYMKFEVNNNGDPHSILFDDVVGTPEPMTLALLGLGGLFLRRRSK
jgi:hypothetical protein